MKYDTTRKLYRGKYQYSIVLVTNQYEFFRYKKFNDIVFPASLTNSDSYAIALRNYLNTMTDYDIRVFPPTVRVYTNNYDDIIALRDINEFQVRSIYIPNVELQQGEVYMPRMNFDYCITLRDFNSSAYVEFVDWAEGNKNVQLTPTAKLVLSNSSRGYQSGTRLYVSGQNTLNFVKMQLSGIIISTERIVH